VLTWAPLAAGVLTGKHTRAGGGETLRKRTPSEYELTVARAVDAIADELGVTSTQVALAWVRAQGYGIIPIVGARKVEQITDSLGSVDVKLGEPHLEKLDAVSKVDLGFPHDFLRSDGVRDLVRGEIRTRIDGRAARR
jgi:aryl-alcohol dehydrogenase-like predicted oxidoreductase